MEKWNDYNHQLQEMEIPRLPSSHFKKQLKAMGEKLNSLQTQFIQWNKNASILTTKPHFVFSSSGDSHISFLHYTGMLQDIRNQLDNHMLLIGSNYNRVQDLYSSQVNFSIAIASFVVSLIGLIVSILSIRSVP